MLDPNEEHVAAKVTNGFLIVQQKGRFGQPFQAVGNDTFKNKEKDIAEIATEKETKGFG